MEPVVLYLVRLQLFCMWKNINKSCELAIKYVNQSIRSNLNYGKGHGPINHLSSIKINRKFKK